jgi:murein DD-endopeptidase MepM/ murein hydrolase activator NlpD
VEHYECYVNKVGDEDYYKVKFDQDGKVNFYIRPEDSKLDISLYVYDENKVLISSKNDTGQGGHELILQIPVKLNKYYYIKVVHINGTVSDVNKKYILRCKNYPNEKSLTNGIDRLGGIDYIGDKDLYEVNITKTGLVEFLVKPSKESLEMNLDLIDSDKDTVISSKDNVDDGNNPISIVKNLTKGTYYLSVSDAGIHNNVGKLYYISYDYADINVTGITISPSNVTLDSGGSTKLSIHITPDNATNKKIVWSSSDNKIATIESDGIVCAKGKGICTITATTEDGNYSDSVMVTVNSNENINATGKITNDTTIYYGPDTSIYPSIDTINNQVVSILWKENSWYYIECNVNGSSQKQRGYIQASFVSDTSPIIITKNHISSIGFCTHSTNAYSGPNTIYKQSGSVSYCEVVKIFNLTEGLFTFIEYHIGGNKKKRAYILTNLINTSTKITRIKKQQMYLNLMGVKDDKTRSIDTIEVAIPMDECGTRLRYFHPDIDGEKLITQSSFDTLVSLKKRIFKDNISASRITSLFGEYYVPNKTRQKVKDAANNTSIVDDAYFKALHEGIDMVSDIGCKFYAFGNGKVIYNGITDTNSHGDGFHLIAIEYDTLPNYAVMYAHAKELNPDLRKKLKQGEELRVTANTWLGKQGEKAPFPMNEHLHLEIRKIEKKKNMAPSTKNYTLDNKEIDVYNLIERL